MWTWQVVFYDKECDRTFLVSSVKQFNSVKEAEDDIVKCCENCSFTKSGIPLSSRIMTAEAVFLNYGGRNGQDYF